MGILNLDFETGDIVMIHLGISMMRSAVSATEYVHTQPHSTGKERDSESGNDYFGARYYASTVGRFLSPDWSAKEEPVPYAKLGDPQSLNLYEYVGNDPLGRVDADGHCCEWAQQKLQQAKQWVDTHPRTVSALKAAGTGALTVTAVVGVIVAAPVSVPAMVTASVVMMGAAGGAAATASYAAGAITGDTKNTDAAAAYVQTVANPAGLLTAVGTGGNMRVAGEVADVTDVVTGTADAVHPAASGAMGLATRLAGAATATNAAADLHRNTPPPPSNKTTPANQQR
jgi:RHS repeat-associated protein